MSSDRNAGDVERIIADAIEEMRDGRLEPARLESIRQLLLTSPEARRCYLQTNDFNHLLATKGVAPQSHDDALLNLQSKSGHNPKLAMRSRRVVVFVALVGSAALAIAAVLGVVLPHRMSSDEPRRVASLEQFNGIVNVTNVASVTRGADANMEIREGDTVRTQGNPSSAELVFPDGTRLKLIGSSSLLARGGDQKNIVLQGGTLHATVAPQPAGRPLLVTTPQDQLQVLGTSFSLNATSNQTVLGVSQGLVRLTRLRDGKSVEVPAGRRVVSNAQTELKLEAIPSAPAEWSEDFESGLPVDWEAGKFVAENLPPGSRGAAQAVQVSDENGNSFFQITTPGRWTYGLFQPQPDSHLHFTFKMQNPSWINVFIGTRTDDDASSFASNYLYADVAWWAVEPGKWRSVSIPLKKFRRLSPGGKGLFAGEVPFQIAFSAPGADRGLVVDRMWITTDGPGSIEIDDAP